MSKIVCFFLFIFSFASLSAPPTLVYRGDSRTPEAIKESWGFKPRGVTNPLDVAPDASLYNHATGNTTTGGARDDAGYVSTTTSIIVAAGIAGTGGYVYHIRPTGSFIDVNLTLGQFSPHENESEFAAAGTIAWGQIIGWQRVEPGGILSEVTLNPNYISRLDSYAHAGGADYWLAGFPVEHDAWSMEPWDEYAYCETELRLSTPASAKKECFPKTSPEIAAANFFHATNPYYLFYVAVVF